MVPSSLGSMFVSIFRLRLLDSPSLGGRFRRGKYENQDANGAG